jgi:hypothetical protein
MIDVSWEWLLAELDCGDLPAAQAAAQASDESQHKAIRSRINRQVKIARPAPAIFRRDGRARRPGLCGRSSNFI